MSLFLLLTLILSVQPINQSYPYQENLIILILCSKLFHCCFRTVVLKKTLDQRPSTEVFPGIQEDRLPGTSTVVTPCDLSAIR